MKKRLVSILATVVMAASILGGCGGSGGTASSAGAESDAGERHLLRNRKRLEKKLL